MYRNVFDDAEELDCLVSDKNICIQGELRINARLCFSGTLVFKSALHGLEGDTRTPCHV